MNRACGVLLLALAACKLPDLGTPDKFTDLDGDDITEADGDCEPRNGDIHPGATEVCDGYDNDCTDVADDIVATVVVGGDPFFEDTDGDGYGDVNAPIMACHLVEGISANDDDCNDADIAINPGVTADLCNQTDDDCDGVKDEDAPNVLWRDFDEDGFGDPALPWCETAAPATPHVDNPDDCDDADEDINPDADERCDEIDNDCNDDVDDDPIDAQTVCFDDDEDGFGDPATIVNGCVEPGGGWLFECSDCDDTNEDVGDHRDWYADTDGDTFGADDTLEEVCAMPASPPDWVLRGGDCDVGDPDVNPGELEVCQNHTDDDCSEDTDCRFPGSWRLTGTGADFDARFDGTSPSDRIGAKVFTADLNLDGFMDVAVNRNTLGPSNVIVGQGTDLRPQDPVDISIITKTTFAPPSAGSGQFGTSFVALDDLDDDDYREVVIGDPGAHDAGSSSFTGSAYVFWSFGTVVQPPEGEDPVWPIWKGDLRIDGDAGGDEFGWEVVATPGYRGDDAAFAVSAPGHLSDDGAVYLVQLSDYGHISEVSGSVNAEDALFIEKYPGPVGAGTRFGSGLAFFHGGPDGVPSLAVGAVLSPTQADGNELDGALYIYRLPTNDTGTPPSASQAPVQIFGFTDAFGGFGTRVLNAGDVNGDGTDDIAVSAPTYRYEGVNHRGKVYILSGTIPNGTITRIQDIDPQYFIGGFIGWEPDAVWGASLAAGDVDDDGFSDLVFGAPLIDAGPSEDAGIAILVYGRQAGFGVIELDSGTDLPGGTRFFSIGGNDHLGAALACGDVDGDGWDDVLIGTPQFDPASLRQNAGAVFLTYGNGP